MCHLTPSALYEFHAGNDNIRLHHDSAVRLPIDHPKVLRLQTFSLFILYHIFKIAFTPKISQEKPNMDVLNDMRKRKNDFQ